MNKYNDFITIGRTTCYFIDNNTYQILTGVIMNYNNFNGVVKISYKKDKNNYDEVYRNRDNIWFCLEDCLLYLNEFLKENVMPRLNVINLSDQLDGTTNILKIPNTISDSYTIYLNGLRQNREDFVINNIDLTLTILFEPIPNKPDILTIEYWTQNGSSTN